MSTRGGGLWKLGVAAACVIGAVMIVALVMAPADTAGPCTVLSGPTMLPEIPEASGLAISRRTPGLIWSHNDSGNAEILFALDAAGNLRGRVHVPARTRDWEDVSAAPCGFGACLYIADIGDNRLTRRRVRIYRVPEPAPTDANTATPEVFDATYVDGPHNAEAMFVIGENVFIITRDRVGGLYRSNSASPASTRALTFQRIGQLGLEAVTDAEASPDQSRVVVRTSREALVYRSRELTGGQARPSLRIPIAGLREPQGEGVALDDDSTLYVASEGGPLNRAGRFFRLRCS